jgi:hypothetical protein
MTKVLVANQLNKDLSASYLEERENLFARMKKLQTPKEVMEMKKLKVVKDSSE